MGKRTKLGGGNKMYESKIEKEFEHQGYKCVVIMTDMGHRCGYVGIPKKHPLYGVYGSEEHKSLPAEDLQQQEVGKRGIIPLVCFGAKEDKVYASPDVYFDVHGGITFSDGGLRALPDVKDLWWFGFDCAHAGDAPDLNKMNPKLREVYEKFPSKTDVVRTLKYCIQECKNLADQLKEKEK